MQELSPDPVWIEQDSIIAIHSRQLSEHGGGDGVRDINMLESAINRPKQLYYYGDPAPSIADMAAAYAHGIAKNHPFIDGNTPTAYIICILFLHINGIGIKSSQVENCLTFLKLASGDITEAELSAWLTEHLQNMN